MPTIDVLINGRRHQLNCADGEETRLRRLSTYVDGRLNELAQQHGQVGDARLLVLASLLIADELSDAYDEIKRLKMALNDGARQNERQAAEAMDRVADRLEQLAAALQTA
jgi:cell division protein ZapA